MNKEKKKTIVPMLRFPEFRDAALWEERPLREILDYERPDTYIVSDTNYGQSGIPVLTANKSFILGYTQENQGIYNNIPVVIFDDFTVDKKFVDFPFKVKSSAIKILKTKGKDNLIFIYELMNLIKFEAKEHKRYYISEYQNLLIPVPKPDEQQKIAVCLTSLDDLITAQSQKIKALQAHKKGLMQQLFPAEGEAVPKFRFREFQDAGEWEEKTLGEVAEIITGNTPSTTVPTYYGGNIMFVSPADITKGRYINRTKTTITEKGYSQTRHIKENSVLFVCIGSTIGKIAQNKYECATNQQINSVVPDEGYSSDFIYSALENDSSKIASLAGKHAVPIINKTSFSSVQLKLPHTEEEQRKIADCFSTLDELITSQSQKLEALKVQKKGLMQQLFPNPNELEA